MGSVQGKEIQKAESVKSFCAKEQEILKERTLMCVYERPSSSSEHTSSSPCQHQKGWETKATMVKQPWVFIGTTNNSHREQEHWIAKKSHVHKLPRTRPGTRKEANTLQTHHRDHRENIELKRKYLDGGSSYR